MYNWLRNYFAFSPSEMRGAVVLAGLMLLLLAAPFVYQPLMENTDSHLVQDKKSLDSLVQLIEANVAVAAPVNEINLAQPFDPNTVSMETLQSLGLRDDIASRWIKYRNSGGKFYVKKDLQKIYGFTDAMYAQLAPMVMLPEARQTIKPTKEIQKLDINLADTIQLMQLRGIGTVLSARIVKFRDILGGFYTIDQLKEVYGITEDALKSLQQYTFVANGFVPQLLNINEADIKRLVRHPYITYEMAKAILNHKKSYGSFTQKNQLKEIPMMVDSTFHKIEPYITI